MSKKKDVKRPKKEDKINVIRKLPGIDALWKEADAHGRCWGPKRQGANPLGDSHVDLFFGDEMVSVMFHEESQRPVVFQYRLTRGTNLCRRVLRALSEGGFTGRPKLKKSLPRRVL